MKEFQLEGEDSSAELLETTVANEMAETGRCNSGINSFAVVDPGLALFFISLGTKWESHLETKLEGCQLFCSTVSSKVQPWGKRAAWHEIIVSCWLLGCRSLPWREAWACHAMEGWPLMMAAPCTPHTDSSLIPAKLQTAFDPH